MTQETMVGWCPNCQDETTQNIVKRIKSGYVWCLCPGCDEYNILDQVVDA